MIVKNYGKDAFYISEHTIIVTIPLNKELLENVDKTTDIPMDYDGIMGVPITFLDKYNPEQFEIIGSMATTTVDEISKGYPFINGKKKYARILIKKKN